MENERSWPRAFTCKWLEPGLVSYEDSNAGIALLRKEAIDRMLPSMIGKPIINGHRDVTPADFKQHAIGYVTKVWFNEKDGWYWAEYLAVDDVAKRNSEGGMSVSCAFTVTETRPGGEWHAVHFDEEITNGEFTHLALVERPRYEAAQIYANSKGAVMLNGSKKENTLDFVKMSPMQRDQYLQSLSDAGLEELANGEYPPELKDQVKRHQDQRTREKEEEMLAAQAGVKGGGAGAGKKNAIKLADGTEKTPEELAAFYNAANPAKEEKEEEPAKKEEPAKEEKKPAVAEPEPDGGVTIKVNAKEKALLDALRAVPGVTVSVEKAPEPATKENAKAEDAGEGKEKDPAHFKQLNNLREAGDEFHGVVIDTMKSKLERGLKRYGGAETKK